MATLTLHAKAGDATTKMVQIAAAIAGATINLSTGAEAEAAAAASTFGSLPLLSTTEGEIGRTSAVLRHVAGLREDSHLLGKEFEAQAQVDQWVEFALLGDFRTLVTVMTEIHLREEFTAQQKLDAVARARPELQAELETLDDVLAAATFFAGERVTIADIAMAVLLQPIFEQFLDQAARAVVPHLTRWYRTVMAKSEFQAVLGGCKLFQSKAAPKAASKPKAKGKAKGKGKKPASGAGSGAGAGSASASEDGTKFVHLDNPSWSRGSRARVASIIAVPDRGASQIGNTVTVGGWVKTKRAQKQRVFVQLNDGSTVGNLQLVVEEDCEGYEDVRKNAGTGSCVRVTGTLVDSPAKGQVVDLKCTSATVMGGTGSTYPLAKKKHNLETLRQIQHLRPRSYMFGAVTRIRNACAYATHQFFQSRDFLYIHTPIVTTADCEGAGEMFQVTTLLPADGKGDVPRLPNGDINYSKDFFGKPTGLTVSGQLQVESFAVSMSDVYTFGPTFRAEVSHTSRHLAEFWMIEPEIVFATLEDDINLAEDYLKFCTKFVRDHCAADVAYFNKTVDKTLKERLDNLINTPFHRISYTDAVELLLQPEHLKAGKFETKPFWGIDLASEHEKYLTKLFNGPTVVYNYPKSFKAFYMKQNDDGKTVQAMDVLVPGIGELMGGSAREDDLEKLEALMAEKGLEKEGLEWYLDLRRYGSVPHAGFGLGFERLVMYMTGVENIKDVIPFPRSTGQALL